MNASLVHRGPDEGSVDAFGACVLGHRRLRVIDLDTGSQPVANETGDVISVFNGELYDFKELRAELARGGHEVRGTGDTPVLPHLYEQHGLDFVSRLEGMFALALWDARRERLVLARDRVGKKPLLWTRTPDGGLAFASELRALLRLPGVSREPDPAALDAYLALQYVPGRATGVRGIERLGPGELLVWEDGRIDIRRYHSFANPPAAPGPADWLDLVRERVTAAVRRRLVADVPLGALLSGGIDSGIVVSLMARASTEPIRTFTVGFGDRRYDERDFARAVASRYGTRHEELVLEPDVVATLPRLAETLDQPLGDEAVLPLYLICEAARRHVTVALTGDGGDEAFAGYERYLVPGLAARAGPLPGLDLAARGLRALPVGRREPRSAAYRVARFLEVAAAPAGTRYARLVEVFPTALRGELWHEDFVRGPAAAEVLLPAHGSTLAALQLTDIETYLPDDLLLKADSASMAHSLELRSPLLDREVLELGLALPESLKVRGLRGKLALRRAFAGDLPPVVARRSKRGFGVPLGRWFRGELDALARDALLDGTARSRGQLRRPVVERLLDEHRAGRVDHGHRLWCLLMLELWQRHHLDARPSPVAAGAGFAAVRP